LFKHGGILKNAQNYLLHYNIIQQIIIIIVIKEHLFGSRFVISKVHGNAVPYGEELKKNNNSNNGNVTIAVSKYSSDIMFDIMFHLVKLFQTFM